MRLKALADIAAMTLFVAYFAPVVIKLKEVPLTLVALGGIALAAIDSWQSYTDRGD